LNTIKLDCLTFKDDLFIWNHSENVSMPEMASLISESILLCDKIKLVSSEKRVGSTVEDTAPRSFI
jgi:hypothetical protein